MKSREMELERWTGKQAFMVLRREDKEADPKYEKDGLMGKGLHLLYVHLKIRTGTSEGYFLG